MEIAVSTGKQKWYNYIAAFFAGVFLANVILQYVEGVSRDPFSDPPGIWLSTPLVDVLWVLFNLLIGYLLFRASKITFKTKLALVIFFVGIAVMSINLGSHFAGNTTV